MTDVHIGGSSQYAKTRDDAKELDYSIVHQMTRSTRIVHCHLVILHINRHANVALPDFTDELADTVLQIFQVPVRLLHQINVS